MVLGTRRGRDRDETETLTIFLETRPIRDVGTSRDRDHNPAYRHVGNVGAYMLHNLLFITFM